MPLKDYQSKRDFTRTPEPAPVPGLTEAGPLTFVVQEHAARRLHYDFRLELDGVLKSWAVTRGPSADPSEKRLAVMVEDHPIDYAAFEGLIPAGQYGAGQVIVWDRGTYSPDEDGYYFDDRQKAAALMRAGLAAGKLAFTLRGSKMKGSWTLVRMQKTEKDWLLIKHADAFAGPEHDLLSEDASPVSGLTIAALKAGGRPPAEGLAPARLIPGGEVRPADFPARLAPMLASATDKPFTDAAWLFEPKLDGYRVLAFLDHGKVKLLSRRGVTITEHYPGVVKSIARQPAGRLVLDGEIIALDAQGKSCFQCLQGYLETMGRGRKAAAEPPAAIIYYVFDILHADGLDLTRAPLAVRKAWLDATLAPDEVVRRVEYFPTAGETVYRAAVASGLEGILAKRLDSRYEPGQRTDRWLKIKQVASDEFVVGGFTRGNGARSQTFGALLLGYYDAEKKLRYAGNVGSGFDTPTLAKLRKKLDARIRQTSPYADDMAPSEEVTWVRPDLVVEVKFAEWTRDGRLRAPVFLRVREDKPAAAVRIAPAAAPVAPPPALSDGLPGVLEKLTVAKDRLVLDVAGRKLAVTNLDKPIWPALAGRRALTKRDLLVYLARVSPYLLPHLADRPLTLSRYPHGIAGEHFWQKHYSPVPDFVTTVPLFSHEAGTRDYILCNNLPTLLWLGQIADLELHTWFSRVTGGPDFKAKPKGESSADVYADYPDYIIFDVDPYIYSGKEKKGEEPALNRAAFEKACDIVLDLKNTLDGLGFPAFVKTSGRTGLHVFVPVERRLDFHGAHSAAETVCRFIQQRHPKDVTLDWAVEKRAGKIFLDYNQNVRGKSLAAIYSPRPSPEATISVPLRWEELGKVYPTDFTLLNVPDRLDETGDIWQDIDAAKADVASLLSGLSGAGKPGKD